jgi:hypothetical protein
MKLLITLSIIILFACAKEVQQTEPITLHTNWEMIQGYWESQTDKSSLEVHDNAMYLLTDSIMHLFSWDLTMPTFTIWTYNEPIQLIYKFKVITLTDSTLILENNKKHYYKLRLRWL